ncbi:MAG: phosphate regulon sensor histidine kinase PhoR [Gammaproteobacteria bacterium]|nr:phosphate regulon sensor histidine kinase PhoR [Gammaproteobacteria bacterium]
MQKTWNQELVRLLLLLLLGASVGVGFGQVFAGLFFAALLFSLYQLRQMHVFTLWVISKKRNPPDQSGGWGELSYRVSKSQKKARAKKKKLTKMLSRVRESAQALPEPTILVNALYEVEWFNQPGELMFGLTQKDKGQLVTNIIRSPQFLSLLNGASNSIEMPSPADDTKMLELRLVEFNDRRIILAKDITHVRRLMGLRQDFVANVSHELRTPLTVVLGYLEVMAEDESLHGADKNYILKMLAPALRMKSIVGDLLTLSSLDTDAPPPLDNCSVVRVAPLLAGLLVDMERLSGSCHDLETDIQENLALRAVESEIYSVFSNLISNAVRYTPDGSKITVRWFERDAQAVFEVKDNGPGIAPAHIHRLTERFYRADVGRSRDSGGTGLGLSIVKQVLRRHDSELQISSIEGQGSVFSCVFPLARLVYLKVPSVSADDSLDTVA